MKKLLCLMMVSAPLWCGAQSEGKAALVPPPPRALVPGKTELTLPQLRDRLVLAAPQQLLWSAYEDKVNAYAGAAYREKPVLASQEDTAVHQIGRLVDKLQNRLAALEEVEFTAKALYASLSPEQQKTANQWLISTIPAWVGVAPGASPPEEGRRKAAKPESGTRPHRPGGGAGPGAGF